MDRKTFIGNVWEVVKREIRIIRQRPLYLLASVGVIIVNAVFYLTFFRDGLPERMYVKFKPAKSQRIHQQIFELGAPPKDAEGEGLAVRGASSRGRQMTSKAIARLAIEKPAWWDDSEEVSKGVLF